MIFESDCNFFIKFDANLRLIDLVRVFMLKIELV